MSFIEEMKKRAKTQIRTIVLPEAEDVRVLKATENVLKEGYAKIILVGNKDKVEEVARKNNINIKGAKIVDPLTS